MFSFVVLCVGISYVLYIGAFWGKYEVVGSLNSRGYFRLVAESSFPSASGFFYICKKCEADPSCSVSCPFDDSQFYKV
jgi:predicted permease